MLSKISWRNIWRNKLRSAVVITSIALGIWAGLFVSSLSSGLNEQRTNSAIQSTISHIQIHNSEFKKNNESKYVIENYEEVERTLAESKEVKGYSLRTIENGMLASSVGAYGIQINGINIDQERSVTDIHTRLVDGEYLTGVKRNPILIGQKLADKLHAELNNKLVLTFQDRNGEIISAAFKVAGIYKSVNSTYDELNVFVRNEDLHGLSGAEPDYQEVALVLHDFEKVQAYSDDLAAAFPNLIVEPWNIVSPELGYADELMATSLYIFIGIILLALAFGIINTMLMAVLERKKELGMLMAVGMNKTRVFSMIVIETIYLALVGGPLGLLFGYLTVTYFHHKGIDLSILSQGLESLGIGSIVYTNLESEFYINVGIMIFFTAILASIYPAIKALQLKPAEAVRAI